MKIQIAKCALNDKTHKITIDRDSRYTAISNTDMLKKDDPIYLQKVKLDLDAEEISKLTNEPVGFIKHSSIFDRSHVYLKTKYLIIGMSLLNFDTGNWDYISINCISHDNHLDSNDMDCEIEFILRNYLSYINKTDFSMQFRFIYAPDYTYARKG